MILWKGILLLFAEDYWTFDLLLNYHNNLTNEIKSIDNKTLNIDKVAEAKVSINELIFI